MTVCGGEGGFNGRQQQSWFVGERLELEVKIGKVEILFTCIYVFKYGCCVCTMWWTVKLECN